MLEAPSMVPVGISFVLVIGYLFPALLSGENLAIERSSAPEAIAPASLETLKLARNMVAAQSTLPSAQPPAPSINIEQAQLKDSDSESPLPRLAFTTFDGLFTINSDGSGRTNLAPTLVRPFSSFGSLAWSGNGQRLAFVYNSSDIYVVNADGSGLTKVFSGGCARPPSFDIVWLPDNQHIAIQQTCPPYTSDTPGSQDLYLSDTKGLEGTRRLQTLPMGIKSKLYFSPEGEQAAFVKDKDIYTMNIDGSELTNLTNNPGVYTSGGSPLVWSPDGTQLAFYLGKYPNQEIYVMNADGSNLRNLTNNPNNQVYSVKLFWSPDSNYIAYYQGAPDDKLGNRQDIYMVNVNTGAVTNLTGEPGEYNGLSWSPDSTEIVFAFGGLFSEQVASKVKQVLYKVKIEDGTLTQLIPEPVRGVSELAWSPEGQQIAFTDLDNMLYVTNSDGSGLTPLIANSEQVYFPVWKPEQRH